MCDVILSRLIVTPFDRPDCQDVVCFITARKRSLGQGNVFTPVCRSVHGEGSAFGGSLHPGGLHPGGGVCMGGADPPSDTTGYGKRVGGRHPTGIHSCFIILITKIWGRLGRGSEPDTTPGTSKFRFGVIRLDGKF